MEFIKNIFTKKERSSEEESEAVSDIPVIEVDESKETRRIGQTEPIIVKSIDLNAPPDVQEVATKLREGNIVILNISHLMNEDPKGLKRAVDQLQGITSDIDGDIGRVSEPRVITNPDLVKIQFKRES